nr:hypothetical protein [Deinococcota bacterium]
MKKVLFYSRPLRLFTLAMLFGFLNFSVLSFSLSLAQEAQDEVRRIVVLPFTTTETASPYAAGMAASLQRSLNVIDHVYVPPVGDVLAVAERLRSLERLSPASLAEAFDAVAVVSGRVEATGAEAQIL